MNEQDRMAIPTLTRRTTTPILVRIVFSLPDGWQP